MSARRHAAGGHRRRRTVLIPLLLAGVALGAAGTTAAPPARAATPGSGTVDGSAAVSWDFAPVGGPAGDTDTYALTVKLPTDAASYYAPDVRQGSTHAAVLTITQTWSGSAPDQTLGMTVTDPGGASVGNDTLSLANDGSDVNVFTLQDPGNETYMVTASSQLGNSSSDTASHAVATLQLVDLAGQTTPAPPSGAPGFQTAHIPLDIMPVKAEENAFGGRFFGEPSIGVDTRSGAVMYQAGLNTIRATFDDSTSPATPTFTNVGSPVTSNASEDAILHVDSATGRTFVSQLILACSLSAVSDDDGGTWTPAAKACETPPAVDHQTIGSGPFAAPLPAQGAVFPSAAYYCSQNVAYAECALSLDGGVTYGAGVPMWSSAQCFGLHGHIKVAPDGTAYVPNKACGAPECLITTSTAGPNCHPGFAVSTNNGASWTVQTIKDGHTRLYDTGDPSIGIGSAGTMYFGYGDSDGHPKVAVCTGQGTRCGLSADVGAALGVVNTEMPVVVAGDDNRAAFAFLGSTTPGDDQENSFVGTWDLYVATTYDGGRSWATVDATPGQPVERGCIEFNASCPSSRGNDDQRNLLDFNDGTVDREGRVLVAYTDGCQQDPQPAAGHGPCATDATRLSGLNPEIEGPAILRQSCGLGLYARYDGTLPACAPVAGVPEVSRTAALGAGGAAVIGVMALARRRRRRRRAAAAAG